MLLVLIWGLAGLAVLVAGGILWLNFSETRLPSYAREAIKTLEKEIEDLEGTIRACKSSHLTTTVESRKRHYSEMIAKLRKEVANRQEQIALIKRPRAEAPTLNPKWDTSACKHPEVEPVFPSGEMTAAPVAWICTNSDCYAQLEQADPAVQRHLKAATDAARKARLDAEFRGLFSPPDLAERARERAEMRKAELALEANIRGDLSDEATNHIVNGSQTAEQAQDFAARTRAMESSACEIRAWGQVDPIRVTLDSGNFKQEVMRKVKRNPRPSSGGYDW